MFFSGFEKLEELRRYFPRLKSQPQGETERSKRFRRPVSFHVWAWAASCSPSVGYLWRERMYAGVSASLLAAGGFRSRDIDAAEAAFVLTDTVAVPRPVPDHALDRFLAFLIPEDSTLGRGLAAVAPRQRRRPCRAASVFVRWCLRPRLRRLARRSP